MVKNFKEQVKLYNPEIVIRYKVDPFSVPYCPMETKNSQIESIIEAYPEIS